MEDPKQHDRQPDHEPEPSAPDETWIEEGGKSVDFRPTVEIPVDDAPDPGGLDAAPEDQESAPTEQPSDGD